MLARVVLALKYGRNPEIRTLPPDMDTMLQGSDAALIIGDPALQIEPNSLPYRVLDLGFEWTEITGLPMVFALWSGPQRFLAEKFRRAFAESCRFGLDHLEDIVRLDAPERGFPPDLVRTYLTRHIQFELGKDHLLGLQLFLRHTAELNGRAIR
jgi:chorismate dehydratase